MVLAQSMLFGRNRAIGRNAVGHHVIKGYFKQAGHLPCHENIALINGTENRPDNHAGDVKPPFYVPLSDRVSGTGGRMFRA